ncbi:hypothetical protein N7G274_002074 [Stereocaulon virgatum]|uniref:Ribosome assembly protein 3 n=1 Tax=Stereocaulon virgatum TaxID=373712 RepID=A0ABR4ALF8_9LECA
MAKSKKIKSTSPPPKSPSPMESLSSSTSPEASQKGGDMQSSERSSESKSPPPQESFESYYLRRVTAAFADDIDKVRAAPDFTSKSVPILIQALKQGAYSFTPEEQERIMTTANKQPKK